jgi:hypothetical protein
MDIAATFRGDRFRLVSCVGCQTLDIVRGFRHKSCPVWRKRPTHALRPAIVAWPGNDRVAAQDTEQVDIMPLPRSDRCRVVFAEIIEIPREFEQKAQDMKKIRGWRPLPGRKARENTDSRRSKPAKDAPIWGQNGGKGSQRLGVIASVAAAVGYSNAAPEGTN